MSAPEEYRDNGETETGEEDFVARWSRRKQAARAEQQHAEAADPSSESGAEQKAPRSVMTDADMPALALLGADSDLSPFFSAGVSEELRRQALRRVFSQPRFNVVDGLDDYAGDYRSFRPLGDLVTAGLRWHRQRIAARAHEASDTVDQAEAPASPAAESANGEGEAIG
jgi:hypothetical protein